MPSNLELDKDGSSDRPASTPHPLRHQIWGTRLGELTAGSRGINACLSNVLKTKEQLRLHLSAADWLHITRWALIPPTPQKGYQPEQPEPGFLEHA